jgi:hypothetical protein
MCVSIWARVIGMIEVRRTGRTPGECYPIPGWVDGQSRAVITWKGTDGPETFTRTVASEHETLALLGSIEHDMDVELVSAELIQSGSEPS